MDYYEELGLDCSAAPDEIRKAYRRLVHLLHPDRCRDDAQRRLADLQVKRLNGVLQTLSDPIQRANYDLMLLEPAASRKLGAQRSERPPLWFCISAIAVLLVGAMFLVWIPAPKPSVSTTVATAVESEAANPLRQATAHPPSAARRQMLARASPPIANDLPLESPLPTHALPDPPEPSVQPTIYLGGISVKKADSHTFEPLPADPEKRADPAGGPPAWSGDWFYVHEARAPSTGLYAPEYIELRITDDGGCLHGRYRARYRVPDRAISPAVAFHFDGTPNAEGVLPWTGSGGAHGEVRLHLLPNGVLEVSWSADQLGSELGLISGTATLIRKTN